jgi:toxin FitB
MKVIDSSGWIELFMNGPLAEPYAEHLTDLGKIMTPTLVIYEVYKKLKKELGEEMALIASAQMEKTRIVPLSTAIAYRAADLSIQYRLATADSMVYATADLNDAQLITSDADFKDLPSVLFLQSTL